MGVLRVKVAGNWVDIPSSGPAGTSGIGVPSGGSTGQVLKKNSPSDYDTSWGTVSSSAVSTDPNNLIIVGSDSGAHYSGAASFGTVAVARALDGDTDQFAHLTVTADGTATSTWPERLRFNYNDGTRTRRTGYFNEYGEIRAVAAKLNTVAFRAYGKEYAADGLRDPNTPIVEVQDDRETSTRLFAVFSSGNVVASGTVTAATPTAPTHLATKAYVDTATSGVGAQKITSGTTAPSSPAVGDMWVDTN